MENVMDFNPADQNLVAYQVLHISSSHTGGAAIAARRLNSELNLKGIPSSFLALKQADYIPGNFEFAISRNWYQKLACGVISRLQQHMSRKIPMSPISISIIKPKSLILKYPVDSTIIHIHNWFNVLSIKSICLLAQLGYKIVFTLHDQRLMTGGCHYALDCEQFQSFCNSCPNFRSVFRPVVANSHKAAIRNLHNLSRELTLIAPSSWIGNQAAESSLLAQAEIHQIGNILVGNSPEEVDGSETRSQVKKLNLGVASMDPKSYLKGGDFVTVLEADSNFSDAFDFKFLVEYDSKEDFWSEIDYLFVPSRADNSPNVILEAKLHRIPVIGTNVGGIPELLDESTDILVELDQMKNPTLFREFLRERISHLASFIPRSNNEQNFGNTAADHISLYSSLKSAIA
jgi:glycosyltransferase involved in cell wall biosynthesis